MTAVECPMIADSEDRLISIKGTGIRIDPTSITFLRPCAMAQHFTTQNGRTGAAKVMIETRNNGNHTIPCGTIKQANQLADTLAHLCNKRVKEFKRPKVVAETDYGTTRLMGDPQYDDEVRNVFGAFVLDDNRKSNNGKHG